MTSPPQSQERRICSLASLAGRTELCEPDECPLWENGACSLEPLLETNGGGDDREE